MTIQQCFQDLLKKIDIAKINFFDFARILHECGQNVFEPIKPSIPINVREKLFTDFNLNNREKSLLLDNALLEHVRIEVLDANGYDLDPDDTCRIDGAVPDVTYELLKNWT